MEQLIFAFDRDDENHWRAKLACGHYQHVRHEPPLITREWVTTPEGRSTRIGRSLECKKCNNGDPADFELSSLLADDHSYLDELLDAAFVSIKADDEARVFECVDMFWARLAMHIRAEHLHLFPAIENAAKVPNNIVTGDDAKTKIEALHGDHDLFMRKMIEAIKHLRTSSNDLEPVMTILLEIQERLCEHNKIEESEVYLWAKDLLSAEDHKDLEHKMLKEITNLPPRFSI